MNNKQEEPVNYLNIENTAINATHEISFLQTPFLIRNEYEEAMEHGNQQQKNHVESKVKSQVMKRKQVMQAFHKEIKELEKLLEL